jgi:uncharacterized coiled-coil protein SlyX
MPTRGTSLDGRVVNAFEASARRVAVVLLCVALSMKPVIALAAGDEDIADLKRAVEELKAQNRALAKRLATLEGEKAPQKPPAPPPRAEPPAKAAQRGPETQPPRFETVPLQPPRTAASPDLEQRVRELELAKTAQEDAVRSIIGDSLAKLGSNINQYVTFGGSLETVASHTTDFSGKATDAVQLSTAELDFEIKVNEWMLGNLIISWDSGTSVLFPTTNGFNAGVDRFTVDRGTVTIGDVQRFPLYVKAGRDVLAFGTSTGVHRADVLSVGTPLTIETFETRRNEVGIGFALPTPTPGPPPQPYIAPPVRPMVLNPLVSQFASLLGYQPSILRPKKPTPTTPTPEPPPFYGEIYVYDANTVEGIQRRFSNSINGRLGYHTSGHCGRPYDELKAGDLCPWAFDVSVDYLSSVFDSNFLESQYQTFMPQFGQIPGMSVDFKANFGPILLIAEYNAALTKAKFIDDAGRRISIAPAAWQVALGYQFDWNPWVDTIGSQGTYVALGYSQTQDLAGVVLTTTAGATRVGFVPKNRILVTAGEWILEGGKIALEYSHDWDYPVSKGGTGRQADGFFLSISYNW